MPHPTPLSPWQYKPWWCQPWSIWLTGSGLTVGSWWAFQRLWLTVLVALPLSVWMGFFLLLWPRLMLEMLAEADSTPSEGDRVSAD